jgi:signal transduction histidine kinase
VAVDGQVILAQERHGDETPSLCQGGKILALGCLAAEVAHDFNNLLTPIVLAMSDIVENPGDASPLQTRNAQRALASAGRAQHLVRRLLSFARFAPMQTEAVDVADLIRGANELFLSALPPRILVEFEIPAHLPPISVDRNSMEAALLNLVINARDAMPDGGTVTIAATEEIFLPGSVFGQRMRNVVRLSVSDTGTGMDEHTLRRAHEPFFSTKETGKGTGLGLSIVRGLVEQSGGEFAITSRLGVGSAVDLWLPVAVRALEAGTPEI